MNPSNMHEIFMISCWIKFRKNSWIIYITICIKYEWIINKLLMYVIHEESMNNISDILRIVFINHVWNIHEALMNKIQDKFMNYLLKNLHQKWMNDLLTFDECNSWRINAHCQWHIQYCVHQPCMKYSWTLDE